MAAIIATAPTGYWPTALSCDSITASVPSRIALATSATSARVGREEATIESSICVAVIEGRASAPASAITCFCTIGTSSIRISIPRSPRATITQSAARTISSARWTACGFSILAISGSRVCLRRNVTSSARRTNESATRSTPIRSPVRTWSRSSSGTDGSAAVSPGMLRPWREATEPPTSTVASISPSPGRVALTRRRTAPSARYMTSPASTVSARPAQVMCMRRLSPSASFSPQTKVSGSPGLSSAIPPASGPIRSLAPGPAGGLAHERRVLGVLLGGAVGEVQAGDVHPRLDHADQHLGVTRRGSDGRDDLRAAAHMRRRNLQRPPAVQQLPAVAVEREPVPLARLVLGAVDRGALEPAEQQRAHAAVRDDRDVGVGGRAGQHRLERVGDPVLRGRGGLPAAVAEQRLAEEGLHGRLEQLGREVARRGAVVLRELLERLRLHAELPGQDRRRVGGLALPAGPHRADA